MADEITSDKSTNDNGATKLPKVEPVKPPEPAVVDEPAPLTAKAKLRAFEDEVLGKDAPRIEGHIERGHGSLYVKKTSPEQKAHYAKLEHLMHTEKRMADASAALEKAKIENDAAASAADKAESAAAELVDGDAK